jgi:hypothetical protein
VGLQKLGFLYRPLQGFGNESRRRRESRGNVGGTARSGKWEENLMSDSDEKILPVIRLLLVAFFGLLFVIALQLFLLVTGANAGGTEVHRNVAPIISGSPV